MISTTKSITPVFAVAALLLLATAAVSDTGGPAVMVTDYKVEPEVLMPGDTGTITVTIMNMDTKSLEQESTSSGGSGRDTSTTQMTSAVSAEIKTIRLGSSGEIEWLQKGSHRTKYYNVGSLGQGQSILISLPIKADGSVSDGTYFTELYIEVDNGDNVRFPVPVKVESSSVEILEKDIPADISVSESSEIVIVVANNRPNSVSGVQVHVQAETEELEFIPERIYIGNLVPYEQRDLKFAITPLSVGEKDLQFIVDYKNGVNSHRNTLDSAVSVKSSSDIKLILLDAPESVAKGEVAKIEFDVANGMPKDVRAVTVVPVSDSRKVRILPSQYFVGDMEVGDVFSASFDIDSSELKVGDNKIAFDLSYRDIDTDRIYEIRGYEVNIEVKEQQKEDLPAIALAFAALLVVLLVVGVIMWRRAKRRK